MTPYEVRISDWSSDVCSSDLRLFRLGTDEGERCPDLWRRGLAERQGAGDFSRDTVHGSDLLSGRAAYRRHGLQGAAPLKCQIGRASCRVGVCQYVEFSVVPVQVKNKTIGRNLM